MSAHQTWFGRFDRQVTQQVRIDFVTRCRTAQVGFGIVRFDAQNPHQPLRTFAIDLQFDGHFPTAEKRELHVQLVELAHQAQVLRALRWWLIVIGRARHSQQFALLSDSEPRMGRIDPWAFVFSR